MVLAQAVADDLAPKLSDRSIPFPLEAYPVSGEEFLGVNMDTFALNRLKKIFLICLLSLVAMGLQRARAADSVQIDGTNKYAWSETSGWLNFNPTDGGGVTIYTDHLSGYVWASNIGWIKLCSDGGGPYGNNAQDNWCVTRDAGTGALSGYAWSENVGWIRFDHAQGHVTFNATTGDFNGYAWSPNVGFINFNGVAPHVSYKVQAAVATAPASLTVPASDPDGSYSVSWTASAGASGYVVEEATSNSFAGAVEIYRGANLNVAVTGRSTGQTYYYRVKATQTAALDSGWRNASNGCHVIYPVGVPASITVPAGDADGAYVVSWQASATAGVSYTLEEALDATFTTGKRSIAAGTALSASIAGRATGKTYYYRVYASKAGYQASGYRTAGNGCVVKFPVGVPASITVPAGDADGAYVVSWQASATAGVSYTLEEALNATFTSGKRSIAAGTAFSASITGRATGKTYYYRVYASKAGYQTSGYRTAGNGCVVKFPVGVPASITVPVSDADGKYAVSWGASLTASVTYVLEESASYTFSSVKQVYSGTGRSVTFSTARATGKTYYYRVKAIRTGYADSAWKVCVSGCAVPGSVAVSAPPSLTFTAIVLHGYTVNWGASTTAGVSYVVEEATNSSFTGGLRRVYYGTARSVKITGRTTGKVYYYRVRAIKPGAKDSAWKIANRKAT